MTPRERMISAFNFKSQDDLAPIWELEFHLYKEMFQHEPIMGLEFDALSSKEKEYALNYDAELLVDVAEQLGYCAIRVIGGYWEVAKGVPAYLWIREEKDQLRLLQILKKITGNRYLIIGNCASLIGIPDGDSMTEFVTELYEHPEDMDRQMEEVNRNGIDAGMRMVEAGADCIIDCVDYAFNSGTFLSPMMFDRFCTPYLNRWVDAFRNQAGVYTILHSDGNISKIMDRIIGSRVHALQCIDPIAGMDIISLKEQVYGKLCLIGNINCSLLQFGPIDEIRESVRKVVVGCKDGGGFILSGCNAIFKGIPAEHYQAMIDAYRQYARLDK